MSLQHERILALCGELKLQQMPHCYEPLATEAVQREVSYSDCLENVLRAEAAHRAGRSRELLTRMAGVPAIKTLEQYDFKFAVGAPKALIQELGGLAFIERGRTWCCWVQAVSVKPIWPQRWATKPPKRVSKHVSSPPRT